MKPITMGNSGRVLIPGPGIADETVTFQRLAVTMGEMGCVPFQGAGIADMA
jgi:hypothetical protein